MSEQTIGAQLESAHAVIRDLGTRLADGSVQWVTVAALNHALDQVERELSEFYPIQTKAGARIAAAVDRARVTPAPAHESPDQ